jgi:uncharacterized repeat protein (TIGR01451 family)
VIDAVQAGNANYQPAPATAQTVTIALVVHPIDLAITIDDGTNGRHQLLGGAPVNYTIIVSNLSATDSHAAVVSDMIPPGLSGATWSCEVPGSATCTATGSGDLLAQVSIPAGESVIYHLTALVQALPELPVTNLATVATGVTESDTAPANNTATTTSNVLVFADSFETLLLARPAMIPVNGSKVRTQAVEIDLSHETASPHPQLVATISDAASGHMATVHMRNVDGGVETRLSWRDADGAWRQGSWYSLIDPAHFVLAWSTQAGARGTAELAEVDIAQGAAILDRIGIGP